MSDFIYKRIEPSAALAAFVYCYWSMQMNTTTPRDYVILPDGYFDLFFYKKQQVDTLNTELIGLSTRAKSYRVKPESLSFAISFKLPAAEFLLNEKIDKELNGSKSFETDLTGIPFKTIDDFETWSAKIEERLLHSISEIPDSKTDLFDAIYDSAGDITVAKLSSLSHQTARQLNRYFRNWFGLALKEYLAILRYRNAFERLHQHELSPDLPFYDQSHFIREVKRFSGVTPGELATNENDRFVQFSTLDTK